MSETLPSSGAFAFSKLHHRVGGGVQWKTAVFVAVVRAERFRSQILRSAAVH